MKISAIIPAFNEEKKIAQTIEALTKLPEIDEIIVVDDGSKDDTSGVAQRAGVHRVITLSKNFGKGEALSRGVKEARGSIICFADADLGSSAGEFRKLIEPVMAELVDMTVAAWPKSKRRAGFGLVKGIASFGIMRLTGFSPVSPLSGQRVLKREVWEKTVLARSGFGVEVGLTVECLKNGYDLLEVPVNMFHRETGRTIAGFFHRGKQFIQVSRTLMRLWRVKARL